MLSQNKYKKIFIYTILGIYLIVTVFCLFYKRNYIWSNASIKEYFLQFTNFVPFRTINQTIAVYFQTDNLRKLRPLLYHLVILIFPGLVYGVCAKSHTGIKNQLYILIVRFFPLLCAVYLTRMLLKMGSFDIDDILLNLVGLAIGAAVALKVKRILTPIK